MYGTTKREHITAEQAQICRILDEAKVLRLGLAVDQVPYIYPMNYGYTMEDGRLTLYLHSAVGAKKLELLQRNPNVCFQLDCDNIPFEGKLPCQYGLAYSSLSGRGTACLVTDEQEKMEAMTVLMKTQTGKDFEFNPRLVSIVAVIRIDVAEYSAKNRPIPENLR